MHVQLIAFQAACMTALVLIEVLHDLHAQLHPLFPLTPCLLATIIYAVVKNLVKSLKERSRMICSTLSF